MFEELKQTLLTVEPNVGHYKAFKQSDRYIVWAEDGQGQAQHADGKMQNQAIEGTIDYFIKGEDNTAIPRMQEALDQIDISYRFNSAQYEEDTGFVHFEWVWQIGV